MALKEELTTGGRKAFPGKHPVTKILCLTPRAVPAAGDQDRERPMIAVPAAGEQDLKSPMNTKIAVPATGEQETESQRNTLIMVLLQPLTMFNHILDQAMSAA